MRRGKLHLDRLVFQVQVVAQNAFHGFVGRVAVIQCPLAGRFQALETIFFAQTQQPARLVHPIQHGIIQHLLYHLLHGRAEFGCLRLERLSGDEEVTGEQVFLPLLRMMVLLARTLITRDVLIKQILLLITERMVT